MTRFVASIALLAAALTVVPAFGAPPTAAVSDIVKPETLGAQVPWLESQLGPAFKVEAEMRTYKVGGCELGVMTDKDQVKAFRVPNTEACAFDLPAFVPNFGLPAMSALTFGSFEQAQAVDYYADCLKQCGNAYDPSVYAYRMGGRVDNMINVTLEALLVTDDAIDASMKWAGAMENAETADYVIDGKFNCAPKYNAQAAEAFKTVKPSTIVIGYQDKPLIDSCQD